VPYLLFQTLYILFAQRALNANISLQYTTPYWLLWYLLAGIGYQLLIPMYDTPSLRGKCVRMVLVFAAALLAGCDRTIGYYASLSRFLVFQPWFLLGYYCRKHAPQLREILNSCKLPLRLASLLGVLASVYFLQVIPVTANMLYGSYSYANQNYSPLIRSALMVIALLWILFLFGGLFPLLNRKLPLLTALGQNTLPVFLLHGFAVRVIPVYAPDLLKTPLMVLAATAGILLLFGNPLVGWLFRFLFHPRRKT
jgi:fucose 4-O-acetylase-like acetyltransferase